MTPSLPDVNVLVALAWPNHVHHRPARAWFRAEPAHVWATTPITELGFVRVSSNARAVPGARSPREALSVLERLCSRGEHEFWRDDTRLLGTDVRRLASYRQTTDAHLLTLASRRGGRLVTFDRGLLELAGSAASANVLLLAGTSPSRSTPPAPA